MENYLDESTLIFEIEGVPRKKNLFKKLRSYVAVYNRGIHIELDGEIDEYTRREIFDVYIKEPVVSEVDSRTTVVEFHEEDEQNYYELEDDTFPGLSEKMEQVLKKQWSYLLEKRAYPETVKWFVACNAIVSIVSEQNPYIFGSAYKESDAISEQREVLKEWWNFNNRSDLLNMLPKLLEGRAVKEYLEWKKAAETVGYESMDEQAVDLWRKITEKGGERCFWAWDLQRLILISSLGYVSDYISWEDALDWCLKAGQKLQTLFKSWDDFIECYLLGYCSWSEESLDDEESEAFERKQVYEFYKALPQNPWTIDWNYPLKREW